MKNRNFFILQILPTFLVEKKIRDRNKKKKNPQHPLKVLNGHSIISTIY